MIEMPAEVKKKYKDTYLSLSQMHPNERLPYLMDKQNFIMTSGLELFLRFVDRSADPDVTDHPLKEDIAEDVCHALIERTKKANYSQSYINNLVERIKTRAFKGIDAKMLETLRTARE